MTMIGFVVNLGIAVIQSIRHVVVCEVVQLVISY